MSKNFLQTAVLIFAVLWLVGFAVFYYWPTEEAKLTTDQWRQQLQNAKTPHEKALAADALGAARDESSVPLLLELMTHDDEFLRARSGSAVKKILGADFYFRADAEPAQRAVALTRYQELWKTWQQKKQSLPTVEDNVVSPNQ